MKSSLKKLTFIFILALFSLFEKGPLAGKCSLLSNLSAQDIHHDPWNLIIYRPENAFPMNEIRCWMKIEDQDGNDVTKSAIRKATYEWIPSPKTHYKYKRTPFLSGGMAMHLNIKPGKYKISFRTPKSEYSFVEYDFENKGDWESNVFEYNTDNPTKVIFVYPTANDNGFYNGGWVIDYKAPKYFKFTQPRMEAPTN